MPGRRRINRLPTATRKLYVVSGEIDASDVQQLADAAVARMFDKNTDPLDIHIPLAGVRLQLIERAARLSDVRHVLHSAPVEASYETSTASATIDSECHPHGSVSAVGRLSVAEHPQDWNDPVNSFEFSAIESHLAHVAVTAVADGNGSFHFLSYVHESFSQPNNIRTWYS